MKFFIWRILQISFFVSIFIIEKKKKWPVIPYFSCLSSQKLQKQICKPFSGVKLQTQVWKFRMRKKIKNKINKPYLSCKKQLSMEELYMGSVSHWGPSTFYSGKRNLPWAASQQTIENRTTNTQMPLKHHCNLSGPSLHGSTTIMTKYTSKIILEL